MITIVAARSRNRVIGRGNSLPWHIPEELAFFKRETLGSAVVMGRKTWDSLPVKPLPGRLNIVLTRSDSFQAPDGVKVCRSIPDALRSAHEDGFARLSVIGGEQIFHACLDFADRIMVTEVDIDVSDGDAFFPDLDVSQWSLNQTGLITDDPHRCIWNEYFKTKRI